MRISSAAAAAALNAEVGLEWDAFLSTAPHRRKAWAFMQHHKFCSTLGVCHTNTLATTLDYEEARNVENLGGAKHNALSSSIGDSTFGVTDTAIFS